MLRYWQERSIFLLKFLPGLFSRSPMFSANPEFSAVPSTAITSENGVRSVSYTHLDVYKRQAVDYSLTEMWYGDHYSFA